MGTALDDLVMELSTQLLGVEPDALEGNVNAALGRLCEALEVDRGYVFKTSRSRSTVDVFEEWWAPGIPHTTTPVDQLPVAAQRFWMEVMRTGDPVHADDVTDLAARCPEAVGALEHDGVRSILFVPLRANDVLVGFTGFEARTRRRTWDATSISRVRTLGEMFVATVDRAAGARALAERNVELERSNRELQQFASVVSHDLKQPVAVMRGFIELLTTLALEHPTRGDEAVDYADAARRAAARMARLIDDVLALARAGSAVVAPQPVALGDVLADVVADLESELRESGGRIDVAELPTVSGSATQLRQLFQNLVANALKFRRPDRQPRVSVSCTPRDDEWHIAVADNGPGVARGDRERVFEMFTRGEGDIAPGLGIGLAVCARVVAAHGGRIWVEDNEHGGATFVVALPRG